MPLILKKKKNHLHRWSAFQSRINKIVEFGDKKILTRFKRKKCIQNKQLSSVDYSQAAWWKWGRECSDCELNLLKDYDYIIFKSSWGLNWTEWPEQMWFQPDETTCHTVHLTIHLLQERFPDQIISIIAHVNWPIGSWDLATWDFFESCEISVLCK